MKTNALTSSILDEKSVRESLDTLQYRLEAAGIIYNMYKYNTNSF